MNNKPKKNNIMFDEQRGKFKEEGDSKAKFNVVDYASGFIDPARIKSIIVSHLKKHVKDTVRNCVRQHMSRDETFNCVCEKLQSLMPTDQSVEFRDKMLNDFQIDSRSLRRTRSESVSTLGEIQDYYMQLADLDQNRKR
jgi:hypothetical protein